MLRGYDVSSHESGIPAIATYQFSMLRATYGTTPDTAYGRFAALARQENQPVIAWHFGRHQDIANQVTAFLARSGDADGWALDLESDAPSPSMTRDQAREFIKRVQDSGRLIGLYDNSSGYAEIGQDWRWKAHWFDTAPPEPWDIWQQPRHGAPIRQDAYRGDLAALKGMLGVRDLIVVQAELHSITIPIATAVYDLAGHQVKTTSVVNQRTSGQLVQITAGLAEYWLVNLPVGGAQVIALVRKNAVTDNGPIQVGGTDPAAVQAAHDAGFAEARDKALAAVQGI